MHTLLKRQLSKLNIPITEAPSLEQWQEVLKVLTRTYDEADQERYLLERSMIISSHELGDLNRKLETAQKIAHLGYWVLDLKTRENTWSKELYNLFGLDYSKLPPDIFTILNLVHPDDKQIFEKSIKASLEDGKAYDIEIRMASFQASEVYHWFHIIAQSDKDAGGNVIRLFQVIMDIQSQKEIEAKLNELNQQLVTSARKVGMAEVANSLLHNIGNVLNSANVSIGLLQETCNSVYFDKLFALQAFLQERIDDFADYINTDPSSTHFVEYTQELILKIKEVQETANQELLSIKKSIEHIRDITALQQNVSGVSALMEKISLREIVEDAIKMSTKSLQKKNIKLTCNYNCKEEMIYTDKNKLLQIIVNLIQNAQDALDVSSESHKTIKVAIDKKDKFINIAILDNGIGIKAENLSKIFTFGFTTKRTGHGYGLHSSALAAKDLGGELCVHSDGENQGATFTLSLPIKKSQTTEKGSKHADINY